MKAKIVYLALALALVFSLAAVIVPTGPAVAANVVTNTNTAETFFTIQAAIDDADTLDGHTITVSAGTYNEAVTVDKKLTLNGANAGIHGTGARGPESIVDADDTDVWSDDPATWKAGFFITSGDVTIDGFKTIDADEGIHVTCALPTWGDRENVVIKNNYIDTSEGYPQTSIAATGIVFYSLTTHYSVDGAVVQDNYIYQVHSKDAIWFQDVHGSSITIKGNKIDGTSTGASGIILGGTSTKVDLSGTVIEDNEVVQCSYGIQVKQFTTSSPPVSITDNTFTGGGRGVRLFSGDGETVIKGNMITNNSNCGIQLGYWRDTDTPVNDVTIVCNEIMNNNKGIVVKNGDLGTGNKAHFNNIVGNTVGVQNDDPGAFDARNNWWGCAAGPGATGCDTTIGNVNFTPWALGAQIGLCDCKDVSGDGGTLPASESPTGGDVTVSGTGIPDDTTLTVATYTSNPGGATPFASSGNFWDVHLSDDTNVNSLTVEFCPGGSGIYYWDGASWALCSNQIYTDGCIEVYIDNATPTHPSLSDLSGQGFGSGLPVGGEVYPVNRLAVLAPWIALAMLLIGGVTWLTLRRRRAES